MRDLKAVLIEPPLSCFSLFLIWALWADSVKTFSQVLWFTHDFFVWMIEIRRWWVQSFHFKTCFSPKQTFFVLFQKYFRFFYERGYKNWIKTMEEKPSQTKAMKPKPQPITMPSTSISVAPLTTPDCNSALPSPILINQFYENERSMAQGRLSQNIILP